jgi:hypothetical protein
MTETRFHNRRAVAIENDALRVTVTVEGGHIAEILDKSTGVSPLWIPPWTSIEPSTYDPIRHPDYGGDAESRLLAGIMGHNTCIDIFGDPSPEEAAAGMTVHGEASVLPYTIDAAPLRLVNRLHLPVAGLNFERRIQLDAADSVLRIHETLENCAALDHPTAWTQHVTLGPPFLERGVTEFRASCTHSKVHDIDFSEGRGYMKIGAAFEWPNCPRKDGGTADLRRFTDAPVSAGFTIHLMNPARDQAYFMAWSPRTKVLFGYLWNPKDFPFLGIWEENDCRALAPWNAHSLTRGMEFGVSPIPESRRAMIDRGPTFGTPGYRWIPAQSKVEVDYIAFITTAAAIPEGVNWDGHKLQFS